MHASYGEKYLKPFFTSGNPAHLCSTTAKNGARTSETDVR